MADQGSERGSFWTSLPGILTGAAALITAVGGLGGLAIWQHNKPSPTPGPTPAPIVNPVVKPDYPKGSRQWCDQKVADWSAEMANGTDDAALRTAFREGECGKKYGLRLGKPQAK
jgi:hypothetical protein